MSPSTAVTGLGTWPSRLAMVAVQVAFALQLLTGQPEFPWLTALAFLPMLASTLVVSARAREPLSTGRALAVTVLAGVGVLLALVDPVADGTSQFWMPVLGSYQMAFVVVRGNPLVGWMVFVLTWLTVTIGRVSGWLHGVADVHSVIYPVGAMLLAVAWRAMLVAVRRQISVHQRQRAEIAATEAALHETLSTRQEGLAEVSVLVTPLLQRAAAGELGQEDGATAALLEARVRDRIRAVRLAVEPVTSAVLAARLRGVQVILLDDDNTASPLTPRQLGQVVTYVDRAGRGRLTIRLNPPDRAVTGTMVLIADGAMDQTELL